MMGRRSNLRRCKLCCAGGDGTRYKCGKKAKVGIVLGALLFLGALVGIIVAVTGNKNGASNKDANTIKGSEMGNVPTASVVLGRAGSEQGTNGRSQQ